MTGSCEPAPELNRLACFIVTADDERALISLVHSTRPGELIFIGNGRHDKTFANVVMFYFLADRVPVSHWYHFDPGLQNSVDIQREIINELEANNTRIVVLDSRMDDMAEPNESARSSGVTLLDDYIAAHYQEFARFGTTVELERRSRQRTR